MTKTVILITCKNSDSISGTIVLETIVEILGAQLRWTWRLISNEVHMKSYLHMFI